MTEQPTPAPDQAAARRRATDQPNTLDDTDRLDIAGHYLRAQDWAATAEDEHRAGCHSRSINATKLAHTHAELAALGHTLGIGRPQRRPRPTELEPAAPEPPTPVLTAESLRQPRRGGPSPLDLERAAARRRSRHA